MPYTTEPTPNGAWHIWLEGAVQRIVATGTIMPLCGGGDPLGVAEGGLVRLEEVVDEFTGPGPDAIHEWVLGSSDTRVCRECAERLVDELGLHVAPVQWISGVGPKRTSQLTDNGITSLADLAEYVLGVTGDGTVTRGSHHLAFETGIPQGTAVRILRALANESWRRETDTRGVML